MIVRAAVKIFDKRQDKEIIIPCHRHCDAFQILHDFGYQRFVDFKEIDQGFLDEHDNFLGRAEAFAEAVHCGQVTLKKEMWPVTALYSEDLW